jgi:hypothetical protein
VAAQAYVLHLQSRQIASSEFAVDRQVEHCQLTNVRRHLQACPNSPNLAQLQRRLLACQPALVPRYPPLNGGAIMRFHVDLLFDEGDLIVSPVGRCATRKGRSIYLRTDAQRALDQSNYAETSFHSNEDGPFLHRRIIDELGGQLE